MPELSFQVEELEAAAHAASPQVLVKLRIACADPAERIESVLLRCQVQIEAAQRRYAEDEQTRLGDLFGEPDRWRQTLRNLLWTHASAVVGPFAGSALVEVPLDCSFDFNVGATKYFHGLADGEIPLLLLFSGTVFFTADNGALQVAQIPWDREARCRLPVRVWREMMDYHYPNGAWLRLRRDVFERLQQYKSDRGIPSWEAAVESLLTASEEQAAS